MKGVLSAREIGEGLPVLIIHGWQADGTVEEADFEPIFSQIPGLRRIYVDLPGSGSTPSNGVKNLDDFHLALVKFIDTRLSNDRFLLIGSSCGAYLARALVTKYIDRIDGLLLRVPLINPDDKDRDLDPFIPLITSPQLTTSLSPTDKSLLGDILIQTPSYIDLLKSKITNIYTPAVSASDSATLDAIRGDPSRYRLSVPLDGADADQKFPAPTLILCGRHDETVGYRDSLRLLELYPRSTFVVLDRGIHGLPIDETGVFQVMVQDWVKRVFEWRGAR